MSDARVRWGRLDDPRFERAFVAFSYLLGRRGSELTESLPVGARTAQKLQAELASGTREQRARLVASELTRVAAALRPRSAG